LFFSDVRGKGFQRYSCVSVHDDRTHLGLDKDTPAGRPVESKPDGGKLGSLPRIGGLHHRYVWKTAA
jgi:hypothetical protein